MEGKTAYHHGALREALLEGALAVIEKEGAAALSLRTLAREAGVSKAAPYRHFANKDDLLRSAAAAAFSLLRARLVAAAAGKDALAALGALGEAYLEFAREHPRAYAFMFSAEMLAPKSECDRRGPPMDGTAAFETFSVLTLAVEKAQTDGWHPGKPTGDAALVLWAGLHGLATIETQRISPSAFDPAGAFGTFKSLLGLPHASRDGAPTKSGLERGSRQ